jgi:hypothetical protein
MKPELQRIAIAEACGWDCDPIEAREWKSRGQWARKLGDSEDNLASMNMSIPDYLNDLNAMHEAEKCFEGKVEFDVSDYMSHIAAIILTEAGLRTDGHCGSYRIVNATASQRAEAFLKTLGKWVDE